MRLTVCVLMTLAAACHDGGLPVAPPLLAQPLRPPQATIVAAGESLQARLDAAAEGAALVLAPGVHTGPITVARRVTLWGPPTAVVRSSGEGSTVDVTGAGAALLGFTIDGSGGRFDLTDAALRLRADDVRAEGLTIERALFGILVEKARRVTVHGNIVRGNGEPSHGLRGDGVRLWEVHDSAVTDNHVVDGRDLVVWYSSDNRITGNTVERCRYGTHFMYSHDNVIENNRYVANVVGIFLMYSRGVALRDNLIAFSEGAGGLGLGLKESGNLTVVGNSFVRTTIGIHSDNSPVNRDDHNTFEHNLLRFCDAAVAFNGIAARAHFKGNVFRDNVVAVRVDGGEDASGVAWEGNDFDDYRGYDLDGDGIGDVPYELRSLSTQLTSRYPNLAFFDGTAALALVDVSSHVMPLFQPRTILVDRQPSLRGVPPEVNSAR